MSGPPAAPVDDGGHRLSRGRPAPEVLVVDDQAANLELVTRYLQAQGYRTRTAASGEEALERIAERRPDLVLLDVVMEGLDGFAVCRRLKSDPRTLLLPVILVTALDGRDDRVQGLEAGADEFLHKPVRREELMARVRALLRLQEARRALEARRLEDVRGRLGRYLSPAMVDWVLGQPGRAGRALGDRRSRVAAVVLSTNLRGFGAAARALAPESLMAMLNEYFAAVSTVVHAESGTVFGMRRDRLLAGFGVPFEQRDAADRALRCLSALERAFATLSADWPQRLGATGVGLGAGADYGEVVAGNVGTPRHTSFSVLGEPVDVAERLAGTGREPAILVTERLRMRAMEEPPGLVLAPAEPIAPAPGAAPVPVYALARAVGASGGRAPGSAPAPSGTADDRRCRSRCG